MDGSVLKALPITSDSTSHYAVRVIAEMADGNGYLISFLGQAIPPSPYSGAYSVAITTATTTAVKASAGVIGTIVNTGGANTTGTLIVYDNTSGSGKKVASLAAGVTANLPIPLGIPCSTGITIVTSAADSWAVSYA